MSEVVDRMLALPAKQGKVQHARDRIECDWAGYCQFWHAKQERHGTYD